MIVYEHPLNERIRTLLRLEDLYDRVRVFVERDAAADHHVALTCMFEILDVAAGANLKSDLLQEMERQRQVLESLRTNPAISEEALDEVLDEIDRTSTALLEGAGKFGQHIRDNEWLMGVKQRCGIPGGVCEFDLPAYHHWLHLPAPARRANLAEWLGPMLPIRDGAAIVLRLLRDSGKTMHHVARHGVFQQMLGGRFAQMVKVALPEDVAAIPEVSANKYALNIRFLALGADFRTRPLESDVEFDLTFCSL